MSEEIFDKQLENIESKIRLIRSFQTNDLGEKYKILQNEYAEQSNQTLGSLEKEFNIDSDLLDGSFTIKSLAGRINEVVHGVGILLSLKYILHDGEIIESMSLGAGNQKKGFDLVTNYRIAEFKFIQWQPKGNSARLKNVFKDFFNLAEENTEKKKYLYVLGKKIPMSLFHGDRSIISILNRNTKLTKIFIEKYGMDMSVVNDYYEENKLNVEIVDLKNISRVFANY